MVIKRRPRPAKVNQPRAIRIATAAAVEGKTPYGRERWSRIAAIIDRTNIARAEIDASLRGVEIGPALARLPVMQHLAKMSLPDASINLHTVPVPKPPPKATKPAVERAEVDLPFLLYAKLVNRCFKNGVPVEATLERIFADLPPAPSEVA